MAETREVSGYPARSDLRLSGVFDRVSWSAVWAGVMCALGMEMLFALFGFFIGFGMFNARAANPWSGISAWTTVWYLVTAGWSMFFGAWCAARLSGIPIRESGILQGITTWGLATVATVAIVGVVAWSALGQGINVLRTMTLASAQAAPAATNQAVGQAAQAANQAAANSGTIAQYTANILSGLSLRIWGGILLGFLTALFGGWLGRPHDIIVESRDVGPTRMAA